MDEAQIHKVGQAFQQLLDNVASRISELTRRVDDAAAQQHCRIEKQLIEQDVDLTIASLYQVVKQAKEMDIEMDKLMQLAQIVHDYGSRIDDIELRLRDNRFKQTR